MTTHFNRTDRVGSQLQRALADLVHDQIKDPRLGMITIQEVRVSRDLAHAKVYFTLLDSKADVKTTTRLLNGARGFLRHELSHVLTMRSVPELQFVYDESVEYGARLSALIDQAVASDIDKHH
jgi:ribosome-binding factor A